MPVDVEDVREISLGDDEPVAIDWSKKLGEGITIDSVTTPTQISGIGTLTFSGVGVNSSPYRDEVTDDYVKAGRASVFVIAADTAGTYVFEVPITTSEGRLITRQFNVEFIT